MNNFFETQDTHNARIDNDSNICICGHTEILHVFHNSKNKRGCYLCPCENFIPKSKEEKPLEAFNKMLKSNENPMKENKGCHKMFCGVCDKECKDYNAYCLDCGRTSHYICGESKLCPKCKKHVEIFIKTPPKQKDNINMIMLKHFQGNVKRNAIEYNGRYYLSEEIVKSILQKEYNRHISEIKRHRLQHNATKSNKQKKKYIKHLDKLWEVKHIAELLNIKLKEKEKEIRKWMIALRTENSILLHHNEELPQYKELQRVPDDLIKEMDNKQIDFFRPLNQIDFLKSIRDVHNSDYRAIGERIMELEEKS